MKRTAVCLAAALGVVLPSCGGSVPTCNIVARPTTQPDVVSKPNWFGRVVSDPLGWSLGGPYPYRSRRAVVAVGGRLFATDARTKRFGWCGRPASDPTGCSAFVSLRRPGLAAWVLLTQTARDRAVGRTGLPVLAEATIWKVRSTSIVLSNGVELGLGRTFADRLARHRHLRDQLEGPQKGSTQLYVDARNGEVLDAVQGTVGCA